MPDFPSIDQIQEILTDLADAIPQDYYKGLSGGIILLPQAKFHPEALADDLYIMGEYVRTLHEKQIKIYYGSFQSVYRGYGLERIRQALDEVLKHELTHHLEFNAGFKDLIDEDKREIDLYKKRHGEG